MLIDFSPFALFELKYLDIGQVGERLERIERSFLLEDLFYKTNLIKVLQVVQKALPRMPTQEIFQIITHSNSAYLLQIAFFGLTFPTFLYQLNLV